MKKKVMSANAKDKKSNLIEAKSKVDLQKERLKIVDNELRLVNGSDGNIYISDKKESELYVVGLYSDSGETLIKSIYFRNFEVLPDPRMIKSYMQLKNFSSRKFEVEKVFYRIGTLGAQVIVDLGHSDSTVVIIDSAGWRVSKNPGVIFVRKASMRPLPVPERGGSLGEFNSQFNLMGQEDQLLMYSFAVSCFAPMKQFPLLLFQGPPRSSKSTTMRLLKNLIDPSHPTLRSLPSSEKDLFIAAKGSHLICFDNLSGISPEMSDGLCKISTGGSISTRQLYSDFEEVSIEVTKPVIANGIDDIATRSDLADRSIVINLLTVSPEKLITVEELEGRFIERHGRLLGVVFDGLAGFLSSRSLFCSMVSPHRFRDFYLLAVGALSRHGIEPAVIESAFKANKRSSEIDLVKSDAVGYGVTKLMERFEYWVGSSTELTRELNLMRSESSLARLDPKAIGRGIRRISDSLLACGIKVTFHRTADERQILLEKIEKKSNSSSLMSFSSESSRCSFEYDDNDDADGNLGASKKGISHGK